MPVRPLTPELAEVARTQLNEKTSTLEADLQHLKDWIAKQPHLRARTDDQWLVAFLRGCKFSLEKTKEKIDLYYSCRTTAPEFYKVKHTDPLFKEILQLGSMLILPSLLTTKDTEYVTTIVAPGLYDAEKYNISEIISVSNTLEKIVMMENDNAIVVGTQAILDLSNVTMSHFLQMTPSTMKKMVVTSQDAMPFRMKGVHYVNTPTGFETVFNTIKNMLNKKNQERLFVHNKDMEAMYKFIPKDILPAEYGGSGGTRKEIVEYWMKKVEEWSDWLTEDEQFGTDERLRPGKPKTAEDMFGVEGSFRKLEVD